MTVVKHRLDRNVVVLLAVAVVTVVWAVCASGGVLPATGEMILSNVGQSLAALGAAVASIYRAVRSQQRHLRRFWLLLGLACLAWGSGQAMWSFAEVVRGEPLPFPSLADIGYLAFAPLAAAAMFALPLVATTRAGRLRSLLDGLLVAASLLLVVWIAVLEPVLQSTADGSAARVLSIVYPVTDTMVMSVVVYTTITERRLVAGFQAPYKLVGIGLLLITVADCSFAYLLAHEEYQTGDVLDAGWVGGFLVILAAAMRSADSDIRVDEHSALSPNAAMIVPYAAVAVAFATSIVALVGRGEVDFTVLWMRTFLVALVIVRQLVTLLENRQLTRNLEARVAERTAELRATGERFAALVAHSSDVVTQLDGAGIIVYQSEASRRVLGHEPDVFVGRHVSSAIATPREADEFAAALAYAAAEPMRMYTVSTTWRHDSDPRSVEITITNLLGHPDVGGIVLNVRNVTDRKELEDQLEHQAVHDTLTGMANRMQFRDRLEYAITRRGASVLVVDLDGFKKINDAFGYGAGDLVLCRVADRITAQVGPGELVARIGGDEFAVLIEGPADTAHLARLARRVASALYAPFPFDGDEIHVAASIGIADSTAGVGDGEQLLRNADLAMWEAKSAGEGSFAIFTPEMHAGFAERVRLEVDLRYALDDGDFELHYQPIVAMESDAVVAVEALIRWRHPVRGMISPADFIPAAESTGLIRPIGAWVLRTACRQAARWCAEHPEHPLRISVNVSAKQFQNDDFVDLVAAVLRETQLTPESLSLEMTEGVLMVNSEITRKMLDELRSLGVRLAIDDFGTGYSSLSYLHQFRLDILKIDRSFIAAIADGQDAGLVRSIVGLAQSMGLETVAEGIERAREAELLRSLGCTNGQGYLYSPPVPPDALERLVFGAADDKCAAGGLDQKRKRDAATGDRRDEGEGEGISAAGA